MLCTHVWAHLRIKRRRHFQTGKKLVCNPHTRNYLKYCMRAPCRQMYINKKWYIRSWSWYTNLRIFGPLVALICLAVKILSASEEGRHFSIFKILFSHVITYFNRFWYLIFLQNQRFPNHSLAAPRLKNAVLALQNQMRWITRERIFIFFWHGTVHITWRQFLFQNNLTYTKTYYTSAWQQK